MITIYGASDDLIEVEGCQGADEFNEIPSSGHVGHLDFTLGDQRLRVHVIYDGCWSFAPAMVEEEDRMPPWPMTFRFNHCYSAVMTIDAPPAVMATFSPTKEER